MSEYITLKGFEGGGLVIALPPELYWVNEFSWSPTKGKADRGLTGKLVFLQSIATGGRPITIGAPSNMNWVSRRVVSQIYALLSSGEALSLTIPTASGTLVFKVCFDTTQDSPVEATPVREYDAPNPDDDFHVTLHFIEVL